MVMLEPSFFSNSHMAPIASPFFLGTVIEFNSNPLVLLTPNTDGKALKDKGLVS